MPNVIAKLPKLWDSTLETLEMTGISSIFIFIIGMILGILLIVTKDGGLLQNKAVYQILDKIINLFRSIPFIILLFCLLPLSRLITGTAIGVVGAIVPLVFGTAPFFSRQVESALSGVNPGLVEAAQSMGCSKPEIIFRVYLKESIPALARAVTITLINLIGLTAMAGAVGAGGLGNFAYVQGQQRNMIDIIYATVVVLVIIVTIIQAIGNFIAKKSEH
jgi:D-methionine transport system permease protein